MLILEDGTLNLFGTETPSLEGRRLVKRFAESLRGLAEAERLPESSFETWGEVFAKESMTLEEAEWLGNWYSMYHQRGPSLGYIMFALRRLRAEGELPEHMIAGSEDLLAQKIIKFLHDEGVSPDIAVNSLFMAAALSHVAYYRKHHPSTDRAYVRSELEGKARVSDWLVDQVLDEVEAGVGDLKALKPILFP
ncbi:TPA: hypothetical protein L6A07_32520 [Pseudomonas aeruginosa]|nr:hypothetical protein [Pseudomonas aeruginosa]